jgi:putative FmdB family regulatory protein
MPLYEYICEQDGEVIELLRPMADADKPVEDPRSKGRTFRRKHSTFATSGAPSAGSSSLLSGNTCCPCGKTGGCGSN